MHESRATTTKKPLRWTDLTELAARQGQVIATWQAEANGFSPGSLADHARACAWSRLLRGVYDVVPHRTHPPPEVRLAAALVLLRCPRRGTADERQAWLSHRSAAWAWQLLPQLPIPFDVVVPDTRRMRVAKVAVHRLRWFDPELHVTVRRGLAVLDIAPTVLSLGRSSTPMQLARHIATADRKRWASRSEVRHFAEEHPRAWGAATVRAALDHLAEGGMSHSRMEALGRALLRDAGLVPHGRPYAVVVDGRIVAEIDIAFVAQRVAIEIDGPSHGSEHARRADEDRRQRLEDLGWRVIRADEHRLKHQSHLFVDQVRRALATRPS